MRDEGGRVSANRTPWIKTQDDPFGFLCDRCGSREMIQLPQPIDVVLRRSRAFIRNHTECLERTVRKLGA